ncbi:MAG: hypothetical protein ACEY3M_15395 [Wolbachia sp.]
MRSDVRILKISFQYWNLEKKSQSLGTGMTIEGATVIAKLRSFLTICLFSMQEVY